MKPPPRTDTARRRPATTRADTPAMPARRPQRGFRTEADAIFPIGTFRKSPAQTPEHRLGFIPFKS